MRPIKFRAYNTKPNRTSFQKGHQPLIGAFGKGDKMPESAKEKISQSLSGKRGNLARNWQGGRTAKHTIIRYSTEMSQWRLAVFERDDYTCQLCSSRSGNGKEVILHADHIKPFAYFPELRFEMSNGRTLCKDCHKLTDSYAGKAVANYA